MRSSDVLLSRIIHISLALFVLLTSTFSAPIVLAPTETIGAGESVEEYVREAFKDEPILVDIAWCESKFKHYDTDGDTIRGDINVSDVGVMQINEYYHGKTALILGIDLHTLNGNLAYARYLYEKEGTTPWASSSKCWKEEGGHIALR